MYRKLRMEELNRVSSEEFKHQDKFPIVLILDNVRSVLNVGSAFRTADAFNVEHIYLIGKTPSPLNNKEMRKTALGGTESVSWTHAPSIDSVVDDLLQKKYTLYGIEQTEKSTLLQEWNPTPNSKTALIFGNEVTGVSDKALSYCHSVLEIPQFGTKHSLNISVSLGIVLWKRISLELTS